MISNAVRRRWLPVVLWLQVSAWGIGLGAKLFELTVLIPAWAANPPESFDLLPYGPRWPNNPGDFFQPLSAVLVATAVGALITGWRTAPKFKRLLWLPVVALLVIWAATPTLFWPLIQDLYWTKTGKHPLGTAAAAALAGQWIVCDWLRTGFIAIGFAASLEAMRRQADASAQRSAAIQPNA